MTFLIQNLGLSKSILFFSLLKRSFQKKIVRFAKKFSKTDPVERMEVRSFARKCAGVRKSALVVRPTEPY